MGYKMLELSVKVAEVDKVNSKGHLITEEEAKRMCEEMKGKKVTINFDEKLQVGVVEKLQVGVVKNAKLVDNGVYAKINIDSPEVIRSFNMEEENAERISMGSSPSFIN